MKDETSNKGYVIVYTGDGKGKTSAGLGSLVRALGADFKVAFIQFVKAWFISEHQFLEKIQPIYSGRLYVYQGGAGFYKADKLSSKASEAEHKKQARQTYNKALDIVKSGEYQLVVCDEINNAVQDGLLSLDDLKELLNKRSVKTSLILTGRGFPNELSSQADIITNMTKVKHHYDDGVMAKKGIDY